MQNDDDIYETIFQEDQEHLYVDREDGHYYLGVHRYMHRRNLLLLINTVSAPVYMRHQHEDVVDYLQEYSMIHIETPKIDIIKLHVLPDMSFSSIIKTYWLRLVQRHWRAAIQNRIRSWKTTAFQRSRELGRTRCSPASLRGLLSMYSKKN